MKQLINFFALAYIISWLIWLPLYGEVFGLAGLPRLPYHHAFGALGPLIASFLVTWIYHKNEGVNLSLKRCFQFQPLLYLIIAILSPFIIAIAAAGVDSLVNDTPFQIAGLMRSREFPQFNLITFFIYNLVFFGFGEEVGWRGFALPRLQQRFNALASSIILCVIWAAWHTPLFFYRPGFTSMELSGILGWMFSLLTGSILLTWLFNSSKGSILICAVFHAAIDIPFTSDFAGDILSGYMGFFITLWGVLILVIFKPKHLSKNVRTTHITN